MQFTLHAGLFARKNSKALMPCCVKPLQVSKQIEALNYLNFLFLAASDFFFLLTLGFS